jgi:hypothetical protein
MEHVKTVLLSKFKAQISNIALNLNVVKEKSLQKMAHVNHAMTTQDQDLQVSNAFLHNVALGRFS